MDDQALKFLWKSYEHQLEQAKILNLQSWVLNIDTKESIQLMKAKSKLNRLARFKAWVVFAGMIWIALLVFLVVNSLSWQHIFFVASTSMIILFNILAVVVYLRHINMIRNIDQSESLVEAQQKTARLQASSLWVVRILFLQAPFYSTWFYQWDQITAPDPRFWFISLPITVALAAGSIWLYRNINISNSHKKWFRLLFGGPEWKPITSALQYMKEIEDFKKEA